MSSGSGTHVGIRELAGVAARAIAVELVLFEAFGRWTSTTTQAGAKPTLAAMSRRHAWHAELWRERFPLIPDADADELVAEARSRLGPLVEALAAFDALPSGPGRLAVAGVVTPELGAPLPRRDGLDRSAARRADRPGARVGPRRSRGCTDTNW